jgi:deoxycytidine triphosphate deaminase
MILSDRDIRARLRTGELLIEPLSDEALQLQPASADLRLGREFLVYRPAQVTVLDPGDPGFEGQVTLELSNIGSIAVKLYPGMRIAQIVLHQLSSPAESPYGLQRGSHYQLQTRPQASQIRLDR